MEQRAGTTPVILPAMPIDVEAEVLWNRRLSPDYNVLALAAPAIAAAVEPGQFVMVKTSDGGDPLLRRPFSVFEIARDGTGSATGFTILSKRVGPGTTRLYSARPGQRISCLGPLGRPFTVVGPPVEAWMVAGGVGLAPFATLAERLRERGCSVSLFYGARAANDVFAVELFERMGVRVVLATEDGSCGVRGLVSEPLADELGARPPDAPLMLYACGPEPMLVAVSQLAASSGRPSQLAMERVMGCGMGGCFSCVVRVRAGNGATGYARSCIDGPVFRGEDIVWE
jgi:dihydroorotate dehydrogenase electron transfer subunit